MGSPAEIHVIAGALRDSHGRVLIAQRPRGRHMAGRWEFPGGKLGNGEDSLSGLKRELAEELGIDVREARPLIRLRYEYPDRRVMLEAWQVTSYEGEPRALDSQALAWARPDELPWHDLLEANRAIVTALRLPRLARVVTNLAELASFRGVTPQTLLWYGPTTGEAAISLDSVVNARSGGHRVLVLGNDIDSVRDAALAGCDGAVLTSRSQNLHVDRDGPFLIGVLCEDAEAAREAVEEGAHFLVVAPPGGPMTDGELESLCECVGLPVFSGWYPDGRCLERLQHTGAHGCVLWRSPA
jgi:8-oxo-dGTP diphosphatase